MVKEISSIPRISIGDHTLEMVEDFIFLGSTIHIYGNFSLDTELNTRIGKAASAMVRLTKRIWNNTMLTTNTKMKIYQACVLSTLLYKSESWTLYTHQERRLNAFHLSSLRRIPRYKLIFACQSDIPGMFALLSRYHNAGLVMSYACTMSEFPKTLCMMSSLLALDQPANRS